MSSSAKAEVDICCANCGIPEVGKVKMEEEECASKLLHSCSDKCREEHREKDEEECQKQVAKMHDDDLFRQPEKSHRGECPICFLPMPLDPQKYTFYPCCSAYICNGCCYAHQRSNGGDRCPFCREPLVNMEESNKRQMKRVKANDPVAISYTGRECYVEGDHDIAVGYLTKAAELGDVDAHYQLGYMYWRGEGVEKDEEKAVHYWEKAAIGGDHQARYSLAVVDHNNGNVERAVKHLTIAANLGDEKSMKMLWKYYSAGAITKDDLEAALRAHQAAIDAMKSPERDEADD